MKTPDEIKKGLECCKADDAQCEICPFVKIEGLQCVTHMADCALSYIQQLENHIGELTEMVEQIEAARPKWISVDDRVPEQFVSVLVYMPGEYPFPTVREGYLRPDGKWDAAYYTRMPDEVTHLANMPEPPEVNA